MPTGFEATSAHVISAAAAAKEGGATLAELKSWGFVTAYEADFDRDATLSHALTGAIEIDSITSVFRTKKGAEKSVARSEAVCHKPQAQELSVGAEIGDETHVCSFVKRSSGYTFQIYGVVWRRGNLKGAVIVVGIKGVSPDQAVSLARVQDKRMR